MTTAAERWPRDGTPDRPAAWLHTVARRRLLDRLRAEQVAARRAPLLAVESERRGRGSVRADPGDIIEDDLLRLVLMCAHPALALDAASALALRLVLGVSTHDIARLFLVTEPAMAARLTRAKQKIVTAGIPFAVPDVTALPGRVDIVARTAYLAFTAGYAPGSGPDLLRTELAGEAIRLVRIVRRMLPDEPVLVALLALLLIQHSRRDARVDDEGRLVLLHDQDRALWHRGEVDEALGLLEDPLLSGSLGPTAASYVVQARIAAEHATALSPEETRWGHIIAGYDLLLRVDPSPGAEVARAVAVAERDGPAAGLDALAGVEMRGSHRVDAVTAELLTRADRLAEGEEAYDRAIARCRNEVERTHLELQRASVRGREG